MSPASARCYWVETAGHGGLRECELSQPTTGEVLVETQYSGISPGTERLVGLGLVPPTVATQMACQAMRGSFDLPIAYGYSLVGTTSTGERVFTMHPHQDRLVASKEQLIVLPEEVPSARATLLPNLETALNAVWDAELRGDEKVAVIGGGAVGQLVNFVLSRLHQGAVTLVEKDPARAADALTPEQISQGSVDVAFHASGTGAGLQLAIDATGFEGRIIELSWYGDQPVTLRLGGSFHHDRKRLIASQVATIAPSHRAAGRVARTRAVLELLRDPRLDGLLGNPIPFTDLPEFFADLYAGNPTPACPLVEYKTTP